MLIIRSIAAATLMFGFVHVSWSEVSSPIHGKPIQKQKTETAQAKSDGNTKQKSTEQSPILVKSISAPDSPEDAAHKQYEHHEKPTLDRWLTYSTVALASFTFFLFVFTAALWWVTYRLSRDARKVATRQTGEMQRALALSETAANAAIESNNISRAAMIAEQRPWVSVDAEIAGPLAYDAAGWDAGIRWHIPLQYRLHHLGKTPATKVSFFAEIIPWTLPHWPANMIKDGVPQGLPIPGTDIAKEIESVCGFPETMATHNMGWGHVLFPGEREERMFGLNGNPGRFDEAKKTPEGYAGQFLIVVCATYGSTYSDEPYRTAKAFNLYKRTGNSCIDINGETIPMVELALAPHPQQAGSHAR